MLISADCVHYGDEEWGGGGYAPFGTGSEGYDKGTAQDIDIARTTLEGPLSAEKIAGFRERVERDDLEQPYKVTWCGVSLLATLLPIVKEAGMGKEVGGIMT